MSLETDNEPESKVPDQHLLSLRRAEQVPILVFTTTAYMPSGSERTRLQEVDLLKFPANETLAVGRAVDRH